MANNSRSRLLGGGENNGGHAQKIEAKAASVWVNGVRKTTHADGSASWRIRYRVPVEAGSKTTRQTIETLKHCANERQARGVLSIRSASVFDQQYLTTTKKSVLLADAAKTFLDARKGELASWAHYELAFRLHLLPYFGRRYIGTITTGDCEDYRRHRIAEGAAQATARAELRYLQSMYVDCRKRGTSDADPVADVSFKQIDNARKRIPTRPELAKLIAYVQAEPAISFLRPVFFALFATGLRIQSVLTLRWEHINFDDGYLRTKQKGDRWVEPSMNGLLASELLRWRPWSEGMSRGGWVFPSLTSSSGHLTQTAVNKRWAKMLAACGVSDLTRHDMRRLMVTMLRSAGADDKAIRGMSGHATSQMIDRYDQRRGAEIVPMLDKITDLATISADAKRVLADRADRAKKR